MLRSIRLYSSWTSLFVCGIGFVSQFAICSLFEAFALSHPLLMSVSCGQAIRIRCLRFSADLERAESCERLSGSTSADSADFLQLDVCDRRMRIGDRLAIFP